MTLFQGACVLMIVMSLGALLGACVADWKGKE